VTRRGAVGGGMEGRRLGAGRMGLLACDGPSTAHCMCILL